MARPTVPHCKDCKYLSDHRSWYSKYARWHCDYPELRRYSHISSQEVRTCPEWCPLRLKGFRTTAGASASRDHK